MYEGNLVYNDIRVRLNVKTMLQVTYVQKKESIKVHIIIVVYKGSLISTKGLQWPKISRARLKQI